LIISLLGSQIIASSSFAQNSPWVDQSSADLYVSNLINSYNALALQDGNTPPQAMQSYLRLYHNAGYSFGVEVVRGQPNNNTITCFIFLEVIQANSPLVIVDQNNTFSNFFGAKEYHDNLTIDGGTFILNNTVWHNIRTYCTFTSNVMNDTTVNSRNVALYLYNYDVRSYEYAQQFSSNPLLDFLSEFWQIIVAISVPIGLVASIVYLWEKRKPKGHRIKRSKKSQS
jgi:hypothetical protein